MILATITLTFSLNNVILLINFLSMITIVGIELSVSNIEISLLILVIYESSLLCLFLVNGILLMSSLSFNYRIFSWYLLINNWEDKISLDTKMILIQWFFNWISLALDLVRFSLRFFVYLFQSINYLDSNSSLFLCFPFSLSLSLFINIGFNRVGNLVFVLSLFPLIVLIFYVSIVNILSLYNRSLFYGFFCLCSLYLCFLDSIELS